MTKARTIGSAVIATVVACGCGNKALSPGDVRHVDKDAEAMLQGLWVDRETEEAAFTVRGDTIFFPDSTTVPATFYVYGDTLYMDSARVTYHIVRLSRDIFTFTNQNSDIVSLVKSDSPPRGRDFSYKPPEAPPVTEQVKSDTVVIHDGTRYHIYTAVNPTTFKVVKTSYNSEGMKVESVFFDNIIHISIFTGTRQLFSRDFKKQMFSHLIPDTFLRQAVLTAIDYCKADSDGFHFNTVVCIPGDAGCYMLDAIISTDGEVTMELMEY